MSFSVFSPSNQKITASAAKVKEHDPLLVRDIPIRSGAKPRPLRLAYTTPLTEGNTRVLQPIRLHSDPNLTK